MHNFIGVFSLRVSVGRNTDFRAMQRRKDGKSAKDVDPQRLPAGRDGAEFYLVVDNLSAARAEIIANLPRSSGRLFALRP